MQADFGFYLPETMKITPKTTDVLKPPMMTDVWACKDRTANDLVDSDTLFFCSLLTRYGNKNNKNFGLSASTRSACVSLLEQIELKY